MAKYKFRISYIDNGILIPIKLDKLEILKDVKITEIKEIDGFTTKFDNIDKLLEYLKQNNLIPINVDKLYITIDNKIDNDVKQKPYIYKEKQFFKKDIDRLKYSYIYKLVKNKMRNGYFILKIVRHYQKIFKNKDFSTLFNICSGIGRNGYYSLTPSEEIEYILELDRFLDFIFLKKDGKTNYKNVHDFMCYLYGEKYFKIIDDDILFIEEKEDNISLNEYTAFNKKMLKDYGINTNKEIPQEFLINEVDDETLLLEDKSDDLDGVLTND